MKVNKINVSFSRTVQMRSFEPAVVSMSLEAQIDPQDNVNTVIADTKKLVKVAVEEEARKLKEERLLSVDDPREKSI